MTTPTNRERAQKLAARPYLVRLIRDDSDSEQSLYLALNPELDGCMAQGESQQEAERALAEFRVDYIEHLLEHGLPVPHPAREIETRDSTITVHLSAHDISPTTTGSTAHANDAQVYQFDFTMIRTG